MLPLRPAMYDQTVVRGPSFETSGYGNATGGQDHMGKGYTIIPTDSDMYMFAETVVAYGHIRSCSPWRTIRCNWRHFDGAADVGMLCGNESNDGTPSYFYKTADRGYYDLAYDDDWSNTSSSSCDVDGVIAKLDCTDMDVVHTRHVVFDYYCNRCAVHANNIKRRRCHHMPGEMLTCG